jgi:hypothetical protein
MKKKICKTRKGKNWKLQNAPTTGDKLYQELFGASIQECREAGIPFLAEFYAVKFNSPSEFEEFLKCEIEHGGPSIPTALYCPPVLESVKGFPAEVKRFATFGRLDEAKRWFLKFGLEAILHWKPEAFERLATTMRRIRNNEIPYPDLGPNHRMRATVGFLEATGGKFTSKIAKTFAETCSPKRTTENVKRRAYTIKAEWRRAKLKQTSDC